MRALWILIVAAACHHESRDVRPAVENTSDAGVIRDAADSACVIDCVRARQAEATSPEHIHDECVVGCSGAH